MKRYLTIFPLGLIEIFTYILLRRPIKYIGLSNFFGFWAIISLALPIYIFLLSLHSSSIEM